MIMWSWKGYSEVGDRVGFFFFVGEDDCFYKYVVFGDLGNVFI